MRNRKTVAAACVSAAALLLVAACSGSSGGGGGGNSGQVTWTTWGTPDELKAFDVVNDAFEEANPDTKLVFQPTASYSEYHSKLTTQLTSNTAPDVLYVGDD